MKKNTTYVIAIDGPAGSGKGTIAQKVADALGFIHFDSGAIYRLVGLYFYQTLGRPPEEGELDIHLPRIQAKAELIGTTVHYFLNENDVTERIRDNEVSRYAFEVSVFETVRRFITKFTQEFQKDYSITVDGRDTTYVIFPNATLKVYLDASIEVRALRRQKQLLEKGEHVDIEQLKQEIAQRDHIDKTKPHGALKIVPDALYIDSSEMTIEEEVKMILEEFEKRREQ